MIATLAYFTDRPAAPLAPSQPRACATSTDAQLTAQAIAAKNAHYVDYRAGVIAAWGEVLP